MEVKKIRRKRVYEDVAEQLEQLLLQGDRKPGDKFYSETELTEMFEVSRATVRQALTILETKGLIQRKQGKATHLTAATNGEVGPLGMPGAADTDAAHTVTDLIEVMSNIPKTLLSDPMEVRMIMEPTLTSLAAKRATEEDIARLEECIREQEVQIKKKAISFEQDRAFHFAIASATKNEMMISMVTNLHDLLYASQYRSHLSEAASKGSLESHKKILKAIKSGDAQKAYDAMLKHLLRVERHILLNTLDEQ